MQWVHHSVLTPYTWPPLSLTHACAAARCAPVQRPRPRPAGVGCAQSLLESGSECPICQRMITKSNVKVVKVHQDAAACQARSAAAVAHRPPPLHTSPFRRASPPRPATRLPGLIYATAAHPPPPSLPHPARSWRCAASRPRRSWRRRSPRSASTARRRRCRRRSRSCSWGARWIACRKPARSGWRRSTAATRRRGAPPRPPHAAPSHRLPAILRTTHVV